MTASVLSSAKTIKMLGMQDAVEQQLLDLRQDETDKAEGVCYDGRVRLGNGHDRLGGLQY